MDGDISDQQVSECEQCMNCRKWEAELLEVGLGHKTIAVVEKPSFVSLVNGGGSWRMMNTAGGKLFGMRTQDSLTRRTKTALGPKDMDMVV